MVRFPLEQLWLSPICAWLYIGAKIRTAIIRPWRTSLEIQDVACSGANFIGAQLRAHG
jgi:hypothetical protein